MAKRTTRKKCSYRTRCSFRLPLLGWCLWSERKRVCKRKARR
jgi:hypothetical protein